MQAKAGALDQMAEEIVANPASVSGAALMSVAESFRGGEGAERFALLSGPAFQRGAPSDSQGQRDGRRRRWAELWDRLASLPNRVEGLNLDRADAFWSTINDIKATARG